MKLSQLNDTLFDKIELPTAKERKPKAAVIRYAVQYGSEFLKTVHTQDYGSVVNKEYTPTVHNARLFADVGSIQDLTYWKDLPTDYTVAVVCIENGERAIMRTIQNSYHGAAWE